MVQRRHINWTSNHCLFITIQITRPSIHHPKKSSIYLDFGLPRPSWFFKLLNRPRENRRIYSDELQDLVNWRIKVFEEQKKMIRFYLTCFDRSLMDYDPFNNAVNHMINYYCITYWRWGSCSKRRYQSLIITTEQYQTVQ